MPVGSTLQISVFTSDQCDPVTVLWGDGASESKVYGGSFAESWQHTYNSTGTYTISASDCGGQGQTRTVNVQSAGLFGGGGGFFDPSNPLFFATIFGIILGLVGLALAAANPRMTVPAPKFQPFPIGYSSQITPTQFLPGPVPQLQAPATVLDTPADMIQHLVSYRDIPLGAPIQPDPRLKMVPGQTTDISQLMKCQCGGQLGYVAGGWFCLNPACPLRH